jgi:hypothetical protein
VKNQIKSNQTPTVANKWARAVAPLVLVTGLAGGLSGCGSEASIASSNLSTAADKFEVNRRIVFYNGITDTYMLKVEGRCSIEVDAPKNKLDVTCKDGPNSFKKHFLGKSDNVTYFVEQLDAIDVNVYHYRVEFKPQSIIPDIRVRGDAGQLKQAVTPR